jgi:hypothetical protein
MKTATAQSSAILVHRAGMPPEMRPERGALRAAGRVVDVVFISPRRFKAGWFKFAAPMFSTEEMRTPPPSCYLNETFSDGLPRDALLR